MATARDLLTGAVKTEKGRCKRSSAEFEPPYMAEGDKLNLVLFGSSGAGKTSAGNAILGQRESCVNRSPSSVCERREGEVCGRLVTVVEMPALCESQLSASTVSRLCASLGGHGVHAFLLVIPAVPLTDEDKAEITKIQEIFGSRVTDYMMAFFTHESPTAQPVLDILQQNTDTLELLKICSNRFCLFNNRDIVNNPIVPKLLEAIEEMNRARESCFSLDMYLEAQLEKVRELEARHKMELEEKNRKIRELEQNIKGTSLGVECKDQNSDCVRIVLVGKTGSGKSATGNTILQREEFKSKLSSSSVTTRCKKGVGEVAGRRVAVVDTPGLFDTGVTNEEVQQEIAKCISFLAPGPHVFLLVLQVGRITKEEKDTLQLIKSTFGKMAEMFTMVIFTRGDDLIESIEKYIKKCDPTIQNLIQDCGNRFHVFNNKDKSNHTQVSELLDKIDMMVKENGGGYYTNEMFQEAELTIKKECETILREKEEEMQREKEMLKAKHEEEVKKMQSRMEGERLQEENERKRWEKELKDKEEHLRKEREEWKKEQEEKERRDEEEKKKKKKQELEWKGKMDKIEKEKSRMKEEWKRREDEEKKRVEREEKQRQEMIEKQSRERKEFEEKQAEENKKRDREEQERKNHEERERREWEQKMKDAEKEKKDMKKRAMEWEQERKTEQIKREEEKKIKQKEEQERREWDEKQKKMRDEFEKEREQERKRREKLRRHNEEIMEMYLEEKRSQLKKQEEEWDKERNALREKRYKEDEQRREEEWKKIAKLQEEFEREREAENQKRKKDDQARREKEEKEHKEMEEDYKRKMDDFKDKYKRDFLALSLKHDNELIRLKEEHQLEMKGIFAGTKNEK